MPKAQGCVTRGFRSKRHRLLLGLAFCAWLAALPFARGNTDEQGFEAGDTEVPPAITVTTPEPKNEPKKTAARPAEPPAPLEAPLIPKSEALPTEPMESPPVAAPEPAPSPEPVEVAPTAEEKAPEETPLVETPSFAQPAPEAALESETTSAALESPTQSLEAYERARKDLIFRTSLPDWSFNLTVAPKAFKNAELRTGTSPSLTGTNNPALLGILFSGERVLLKRAGLLSVGLESGVYGSTTKDLFGGLITAMFALGPYVQYQAAFLSNQWVVPALRAEYEFVRYNYSFNNLPVRGLRGLPRFDLGLLFFLNVIEPSSAGLMNTNYGIKRTYLAAYLSSSADSSKQDLNLQGTAFRFALRFEY